MNEHDFAVLTRPLDPLPLQEGDVGVIVHCYSSGSYEVEFVSGDGKTVGVVTLQPGDVRPLSNGEILHARKIPA